jgi:hypothetical protein
MVKLSKDLEVASQNLDAFEDHVKSLTVDELNKAPVKDYQPETKLSTREVARTDGVYLKPDRSISCKEKFNETYRDEYNYRKEYVRFIAENREVGGEVETWTRPFPGLPAEFWKVPTNKVVIGPRYLAERIAGCSYTRLSMDEGKTVGSDGSGTYYGQIVATNKIQRLNAMPAGSLNKSQMSSNF